MIIRKLTADCGSLEGTELELADGLNIIRLSSEDEIVACRSFIYTLLFGSNGSLPLYDTRKPPLTGTMQISCNGRDISLERTNNPTRSEAVYSDTGEAYDAPSLKHAIIPELMFWTGNLQPLVQEQEAVAAEIKALRERLSPLGRLITRRELSAIALSFEDYRNCELLLEDTKKNLSAAINSFDERKKEPNNRRKRSFSASLSAMTGISLIFISWYRSLDSLMYLGMTMVLAAIIIFGYELKHHSGQQFEYAKKIMQLRAADANERYTTTGIALKEAQRRARSFLSRLTFSADFEDRYLILRDFEKGLQRLESLTALLENRTADTGYPLILTDNNEVSAEAEELLLLSLSEKRQIILFTLAENK